MRATFLTTLLIMGLTGGAFNPQFARAASIPAGAVYAVPLLQREGEAFLLPVTPGTRRSCCSTTTRA